jgi:glycosyltransferase involved in cell wall biosynthesis
MRSLETRLRVLASSPACLFDGGSEATVGAKVIDGLNQRYDVDLVTLKSGGIDSLRKTYRLDCEFDDLNDVSWASLCRFERMQKKLTTRSFLEPYSVIHRVTPSGWKNSLLLPLPSQRVVVGPILLSNPPPASFNPIFRPQAFNRPLDRFTPRRILASIARRYLEKNDSRLLDRADLIFCGSRVTRERLSKRQQDRSVVVHFSGVEHQRFVPPKGRQRNKALRLLFAGRLVPYKGLELLLRAVAVLKKRIAVKLFVVGSSNPRTEAFFVQIASDLGLANEVEFVGKVTRDRLIDFYQRSDLFCMPSVETYGLAILEAMSCGCVPVVADFNGPGEIVDTDFGIKVPLTDPESFIGEYADAIESLGNDPEFINRFRLRSREVAVTRHDWNAVLSPIRDAYERLLHSAKLQTSA